ncbi:MAG: hypothetical protein H8D69_01265 [Chloroflexi bacterium]|nr:hypothetical protein [Chloroflexota bacterium]
MSDRNPVTSDDLRVAAELCSSAVAKLDEELWDKLAYGLEWTRSQTLAHVGTALVHYSNNLGARTQDNPGTRGLLFAEGSIEAAGWQVRTAAYALAAIADATPPETRAYHRTGMPDVEGFLAMGCVEILLHGHDAVVGTDAEFDPDDELCKRILGRLFPWAPLDKPGWLALLWATGRGDLEDRETLGNTWMWHNDLLSEWEGEIPDTRHWVTRN